MKRVWIAATLAASMAGAAPVSLDGLGDADHGHLSMLFEVTFMKIDVAQVDVYLDSATAAEVGTKLSIDDDDDREAAVADVILASDQMGVTMQFARDAGVDRILKGMKGSFEAAVDGGFVTETYADSLWPHIERDFQTLGERGVKKGDTLTHRVDGSEVRSTYSDGSGEVLIRFHRAGPEAAISVVSSFFAPDTRFRRKLIRSLTED